MTFFHLKYTRSLWDLEWTDTTKKNTQKKKKKTTRRFKNRWKSIFTSRKNKEKSAPGKCYKQSVQNISYFNKETVYKISKKTVDWWNKILLGLKSNKRFTKKVLKNRNFNIKKIKNQYQKKNQYKKKSISKKINIKKINQ